MKPLAKKEDTVTLLWTSGQVDKCTTETLKLFVLTVRYADSMMLVYNRLLRFIVVGLPWI